MFGARCLGTGDWGLGFGKRRRNVATGQELELENNQLQTRDAKRLSASDPIQCQTCFSSLSPPLLPTIMTIRPNPGPIPIPSDPLRFVWFYSG